MSARQSYFKFPHHQHAYVDSNEENLVWILKMFVEHGIDLFCRHTFDYEVNQLILHMRSSDIDHTMALRLIFNDMYSTPNHNGIVLHKSAHASTFKRSSLSRLMADWPQFKFHSMDEVNDLKQNDDDVVSCICFKLKKE